jgi:hypothetical protein
MNENATKPDAESANDPKTRGPEVVVALLLLALGVLVVVAKTDPAAGSKGGASSEVRN